jgi:hypothetical protein
LKKIAILSLFLRHSRRNFSTCFHSALLAKLVLMLLASSARLFIASFVDLRRSRQMAGPWRWAPDQLVWELLFQQLGGDSLLPWTVRLQSAEYQEENGPNSQGYQDTENRPNSQGHQDTGNCEKRLTRNSNFWQIYSAKFKHH